MKKLSACCCIALTFIIASCTPGGPELPADQANKMRQHRLTPSEDGDLRGESSQLPSAAESGWKF